MNGVGIFARQDGLVATSPNRSTIGGYRLDHGLRRKPIEHFHCGTAVLNSSIAVQIAHEQYQVSRECRYRQVLRRLRHPSPMWEPNATPQSDPRGPIYLPNMSTQTSTRPSQIIEYGQSLTLASLRTSIERRSCLDTRLTNGMFLLYDASSPSVSQFYWSQQHSWGQ